MLDFKNEAETATIYFYGAIGDVWDGITTKDFADTLAMCDGKPIDIHIDSPGGDVFAAFAIASLIKSYSGKVTAYVDGLAASGASIVALMCDEVIMQDYSQIMIHKSAAYIFGNSDDLLKCVEQLNRIDQSLADIVLKRSNFSDIDQVMDALKAETWYTGTDALDAGLCDQVIETGQKYAAFAVAPDIYAQYKTAPKNISPKEETKEEPQAEPKDEPSADISNAANNISGSAQLILLGNHVYTG